jgi:D-alanyl-D-alanine carboxypeptidase
MNMKKKVILPFAVIVILLGALFVIKQKASAPSGETGSKKQTSKTTQSLPPEPGFNKTLYSTTDPASPWVIVNKVNALPSSYAPGDLTSPNIGGYARKQAADALDQLVDAAVKDGINLIMLSSYRSYATQVSTYNGYVAKDGKAAADTYSARPGHSEHQTGWAADLGNGTCDLEICFGNTKSGKWLAAHAHEYGFIIRYQLGKEAITGYQYEPWHLRFVGLELSSELFKTGQTMEEFFGVVPAKQPY